MVLDAKALTWAGKNNIDTAKLKAAKVPCELVVKPKAGHGWKGMDKDFVLLADWFDKHLAKHE